MPSSTKILADFVYSIMRTSVWQDDGTLKLYLYCFSMASHNTCLWRGRLIQPGDLPLSERKVSNVLSWSRSKLRNKLQQLSDMGLIDVITSPQSGTMIHMKNWHMENNAASNEAGMSILPENDHKRTSVEPVADPYWFDYQTGIEPDFVNTVPVTRQEHTISASTGRKNIHNPIEEKKRVSSSPIITEPTGFTDIWVAYPANRRTRRSEAAQLVNKALENGATIEAILTALEADKHSSDWNHEQGRFIPGIVKWLEKETWRNYLPQIAPEEDEEAWISR